MFTLGIDTVAKKICFVCYVSRAEHIKLFMLIKMIRGNAMSIYVSICSIFSTCNIVSNYLNMYFLFVIQIFMMILLLIKIIFYRYVGLYMMVCKANWHNYNLYCIAVISTCFTGLHYISKIFLLFDVHLKKRWINGLY